MASKKTAPATPPMDTANTLKVEADDKKGMPRIKAEVALTSEVLNASTARKYVASVTGELEFTELVTVMREKTAQVKAGDLSGLEATLTAQAVLLDGIFNEMARRASLNMHEHLKATDLYLRLALKAQSQCRSTIEAIAEIKNPRPVAFVKQANIAHGPQQVNNGVAQGESLAHAGNGAIPSNEQLGVDYGERLDTRAQSATSASNQELVPVGKIDRAAK